MRIRNYCFSFVPRKKPLIGFVLSLDLISLTPKLRALCSFFLGKKRTKKPRKNKLPPVKQYFFGIPLSFLIKKKVNSRNLDFRRSLQCSKNYRHFFGFEFCLSAYESMSLLATIRISFILFL